MIAVVFLLLYVVFGSMLRGWVFSVMWSWFIVPFGAPQIGVAHAIGVGMAISFITYQQQEDGSSTKDATERMIAVCITGVMHALITIGVGWVVHSFMAVR